ncbi:hypothetical protein KUTeg_024360 [Tegillarca granosa]|uniref:Uncharacterized protein n=1 Tax=Tegillarca granosa TaxID=220873 RepID=A0ABQ9DX33_TEGGR|nr:hypothetical protein KUTeg_024360 [Tegillarca granosa]
MHEWTDDFLTWRPSDYSNIEKIVVPASKIWLPDIALDSRSQNIERPAFESTSDVYNSAHTDLFRVSVYFDGTVVWEPGGSFSTSCNIKIRYFPFDYQTCEITFTVWQYTKGMMSVTNSSDSINMETYTGNGEWVVKSTSMESVDWHDPSSTGDVYSEVLIKFRVRRKFMYYFINIILPCLLMSVLVLVVFHLPPDSGEKVSLGVTVLLAFSVFQNISDIFYGRINVFCDDCCPSFEFTSPHGI